MVARRHRASTVQGWTTLRLTMLGTSAERNRAEQNGEASATPSPKNLMSQIS
jgi:hypothetical protein